MDSYLSEKVKPTIMLIMTNDGFPTYVSCV